VACLSWMQFVSCFAFVCRCCSVHWEVVAIVVTDVHIAMSDTSNLDEG